MIVELLAKNRHEAKKVEDLDNARVKHKLKVSLARVAYMTVQGEDFDITNNYRLPRRDYKKLDVRDSVALPPENTRALHDLFSALGPMHGMDCHDLINEVFGINPLNSQHGRYAIIDGSSQIMSGQTYSVVISRDRTDWRPTHSCIGTEQGKLLAITGLNGSMDIMDMETTKAMWSYNYPYSELCRAFL